MDEKEAPRRAGKPFVVGVVTVLAIVILVGVLFYLSPREAVAGKAIQLTSQGASVVASSGVDTPQNILSGGSATVKEKSRVSGGLTCPTGFASDGNGNCGPAGDLFNGWLHLRFANSAELENFIFTVSSGTCGTGDCGGASPNPSGVRIYFKDSVSSPWVSVVPTIMPNNIAITTGQSLPVTVNFDNRRISEILLARTAAGPNAPDLIFSGLQVDYSCRTEGGITTINGVQGICQNGVLVTDLSCTQQGLTSANAFCDGMQWVTQCNLRQSRFIEDNGQPSGSFAGDGTADGCVSLDYRCVSQDGRAYPSGIFSVDSTLMCSNDGNWYRCGPRNSGEVRDGLICVNNQWQPAQCTQRESGRSSNGAYCNGQQWTSECTFRASRSILPDQSNPQGGSAGACCTENSCTGSSPDGSFPQWCYSVSSMNGDSSLVCSGGDWLRCDSSARESRGYVFQSTQGPVICSSNNRWLPAVCQDQEVGKSYGQAYCNDQRQWVDCPTNVFCLNTINGLEDPILCDSLTANSISPDRSSYCTLQGGTGQWITCNRDTLGQGVTNAPNGEAYAEAYVCVETSLGYRWAPTNCQACSGNGPGKCVGSSIVDVVTGRSRQGQRDEYYRQTALPLQQVGCVSETVPQCTFNTNLQSFTYNLDDRFTLPYGEMVCGDNYNLLRCDPNSQGYVPSDGGRWLCGRDINNQVAATSTWVECDSAAANARKQLGNFVCLNMDGKFQWFSEFSCSATAKYRLKDQSMMMCDGEQWRACEYFDNNPIQDYNINFQCQHPSEAQPGQRTIGIAEAACTNGLDDDNDGVSDCADLDCFNSLGPDGRFTVTMKRYGCLQAAVDSLETAGTDFQDLHLCDEGTERLSTMATLCATGGSAGQTRVQVQSISALRTAARQPTTYAQNSITFLYFEPSSGLKEVHAVYTAIIPERTAQSTDRISFDLSNFVPNMVNEQKLLLRMGALANQFYMLQFPSNATLFSFEQLQLMHIPTMKTYTIQQYAGSNEYLFQVENQQVLVVEVDTQARQIHIFSRASGITGPETAAGYVVPYNLDEQLEVQFTQASPVEITSPAEVARLTICREDNPADTVQALLCRADPFSETFGRIASLRLGNLTRLRIGQTDYAFLYELKDGVKQISMYNIQSPITPPPQIVQPANNLPYNQFINAMTQGRRVAVNMTDDQGNMKLYLAEHPIQSTFNLQDVKLKRYTPAGTTEFPASGSVDRVEFMVLDGRLTIQRNYGTPPPPFDLYQETKRQITDRPLNLQEKLFTSFSSKVPVRIDGPSNYGILSVAPNDIALDQPVFRVQRTAPGASTFDLPFQVPVVDGIPLGGIRGVRDTLFYYHTAAIEGEIPIKTASVYRLYELPETGSALSHPFNNQFIATFTQGSEVALKFQQSLENKPESYYLLGYEGADSTVQFFDTNKVTLKSLKDSTNYAKIVTGRQVLFTTPEGTVNISVVTDSTGADRIEFSTITQIRAATEQLRRDYSYRLSITGQVLIDNQLFSMCNVELYRSVTQANICYGQGTSARDIIVDGTKTFTPRPGTSFLLRTNGRTGDEKEVIVYKLITLNSANARFRLAGNLNWTWFTDHVMGGDTPVFNITGNYYVPITSSNLVQDLQFQLFDGAQRFQPRNLIQKTPILFNASYVFGEDVLVINQSLTGAARSQTVGAVLELQSYSYLPEDRSEVVMNVTANNPTSQTKTFTVVLNSHAYTLLIEPVTNAPQVVRVQLQREGTMLLQRYFTEGMTRRLTVEGQQFEIRVKRINTGEDRQNPQFQHADITIRRVQ